MLKSHSALIQYHLVHIAATPAIFWWLDAGNGSDPPTKRVIKVTCFVTFSQLIATIIYNFASKHSHRQSVYNLQKDGNDSWSRQVTNILESSIVFVSSVLIFHLLIVLLGGPVIDHFEGTLSLSWLLAVIVIIPLLTIKSSPLLIYYSSVPAKSTRSQTKKRITRKLQESLVIDVLDSSLGTESFLEQLRRTNPLTSGFDALDSFQVQNVYFVVVGVWFSVFFVKLDWMQPWQEYPVTCIVSSLILNFLSHFTHCLFLIFSSLI